MRRTLLLLLWLLSDGVLFVGAYTLAYFLKVGWIFSTDLPFPTYLSAILLTAPVWVLVMVTMRNYGLSRIQVSPRNFVYIAYACLIGMAAFTLVFYFLKQSLFSRFLLLLAGTFSTLAIFCWHAIFDAVQRHVLRWPPPVFPLLIVGTNRDAEHLVRRLEGKRSPFRPVAVLDGRGTGARELAGVPVLGKLDALEETLERFRITHLVQCDQIEQSINLLSVCRQHGITYMLLPFVLGVIEDRVPTEALEGQQVITVSREPAWAWFFR